MFGAPIPSSSHTSVTVAPTAMQMPGQLQTIIPNTTQEGIYLADPVAWMPSPETASSPPASDLRDATGQPEITIQQANAKLYEQQKQAEASLYAREAEAEAKLFEQQKEAENIRAMYVAKADCIGRMLSAFSGNHVALQEILMLERGTYTELASINATAVKGLQPKISV
ncbi:hypothetical protein DFQ27_009465 [Actinomortierella ambigua]|uniref:Uncharacterized protein n=1 Tax=Actinomortierella ambigua TaxID=1343610 RepID=A0A9P6TXF7_9FUNG|nr:hypothetical protein DFQ27_009465 [Actinomortierella ambigua]